MRISLCTVSAVVHSLPTGTIWQTVKIVANFREGLQEGLRFAPAVLGTSRHETSIEQRFSFLLVNSLIRTIVLVGFHLEVSHSMKFHPRGVFERGG